MSAPAFSLLLQAVVDVDGGELGFEFFVRCAQVQQDMGIQAAAVGDENSFARWG